MIQPGMITDFYIENYVPIGGVAVDATAGNGYDTLKLCKAVGECGRVYAFDIQEKALEETRKRLEDNNFYNAKLILDSHSEMEKYIDEPVDAVIFNLGYLPCGDHNIHTKYDTTIAAIEKALSLLKENGFVAVTVYHGANSGSEEKEAVMNYLKNLDYKSFTVLTHDFHNRPNNPPICVSIFRNY